jgi:hypothetical protein
MGTVSRHLHSFAALLACAALLSGCNIGCAFAPCTITLELDVVVVVKDPSGAAVPGVRVDVFDFADETGSKGCVEIDGNLHRGASSLWRDWRPSDVPVELRAEKAGFKPLLESKPFNSYRIDITLQPTSSSKRSSAVWTPATSIASLDCD